MALFNTNMLVLLLSLLQVGPGLSAHTCRGNKVVLCNYVGDGSMDIADINGTYCTHLVYSNTLVDIGELALKIPYTVFKEESAVKLVPDIKSEFPGLQSLIAVELISKKVLSSADFPRSQLEDLVKKLYTFFFENNGFDGIVIQSSLENEKFELELMKIFRKKISEPVFYDASYKTPSTHPALIDLNIYVDYFIIGTPSESSSESIPFFQHNTSEMPKYVTQLSLYLPPWLQFFDYNKLILKLGLSFTVGTFDDRRNLISVTKKRYEEVCKTLHYHVWTPVASEYSAYSHNKSHVMVMRTPDMMSLYVRSIRSIKIGGLFVNSLNDDNKVFDGEKDVCFTGDYPFLRRIHAAYCVDINQTV